MTNHTDNIDVCPELIEALKHIRFIHYALIIASIIVFVASERKDTYYHRVSEQLSNLQSIINHYDGHWLHEYIYNKSVINNISFEKYENIGGYLGTIDRQNISDIDGTTIQYNETRNFFIPKWLIITKDGALTTSLSESFKNKYDEFREIINTSNKNQIVLDAISCLDNFDKINKVYIIKQFPIKGFLKTNLGIIEIDIKEASSEYLNEYWQNSNIADFALPHVTNSETIYNKSIRMSYNYVIKPTKYISHNSLKELSINVEVEEIGVEQLISSLFYDTVRLQNVQQGSLKSKFQDFLTLPNYFKRMPINDLVSYLEDMKKNLDSEVKMFGINIPRANVSTWGVALIFTFQLYLLLHLSSLCENYPIPNGRKIPIFPSILCYPQNIVAKFCIYVSICFFPLAAVIFGGGRIIYTAEQIEAREFYCSIAIVSSAIVTIQLYHILGLWISKLSDTSDRVNIFSKLKSKLKLDVPGKGM